jgi:hypothetical protein
MTYDHGNAREFVASLGGMKMDETALAAFDRDAQTFEFTQEQFDMALRFHARVVKHYFTPTSYSFSGRLGLAVYFVFQPVGAFFKRHWKTAKEAFELRKL